MKNLVIYVHGKGGNADEALHYKSLFPNADVLGFDYKAETPWDAKKEFPVCFDSVLADYDEVTLIANSIGAFFSMNALADKPVKQNCISGLPRAKSYRALHREGPRERRHRDRPPGFPKMLLR